MHPSPPGAAIVAQGAHDYLRELERALTRRGIEARILRPPKEHCGT